MSVQRIRDYRMLSKAYPETRRTGDILSCTIGYSAELRRLIRFAEFPYRVSPQLRRWEAIEADFDRTSDSRLETLTVVDGTVEYAQVRPKLRPIVGMAEVRSLFLIDGIETLNAEQRSIGVVCPRDVRPYWTVRGQDETSQGLVGLSQRLRVKYETDDGRSHDQTVLDWQYYEAARAMAGRYEDPHLEAIRRLTDPSYETLFVVGNIKAHRTAFVVVGVLQAKAHRR